MKGRLLQWRRRFFSAPVLGWYRRRLPPISDTEREALEAGTVGWDAELFSGRPDWDSFLDTAAPHLSEAEQAFLDGPVEQLCAMLDDWDITERRRGLPPEVWAFMCESGMLGMIIPHEYGGLGFSALAHSAVVMKLSTRSISGSISVMVPNSLGPGELLLHYGTEAQKRHYLPRLARGEEIPCFALTGPWAGSDAASMRDYGVVCVAEHQGREVTGIRLSWEKRYITLAPRATLLGLAFKLSDPDGLLGGPVERGITLALIPASHPGVEIGRRHWPAKQAFANGPTRGQDVFIPLTWVIGEDRGVGRGWQMLMHCLSAGRAISLPSLSTGATRFAARVSGAYARVRRQFGVPIGRFEGVQEPLARIGVQAYVLDAARAITCAAIDTGARPAVISALMKYQFTDRMRRAVEDAMDIHGGRAICEGPRNYLSNAYQALPIAITVEGANILTRCLIVFGQGAVRCHPWLVEEMAAATDPDPDQALERFDRALAGHIRHLAKNLLRTVGHGFTAARFVPAPVGSGELAQYYRAISRYSAVYALVADAALVLLGGGLKRREMLSGRMADILSEMYLTSCVLKRFRDDGSPQEDLPLVHAACRKSLLTIERRFRGVLRNFPSPVLGRVLRLLAFPWGFRPAAPEDSLIARCASLLLEPGPVRDRLTRGIYVSEDPDDITGCLEYAMRRMPEAEALEARLAGAGPQSRADRELLERIEHAVRRVIDVDDFDPAELTGPRAHATAQSDHLGESS